jgi:hypothetical protein
MLLRKDVGEALIKIGTNLSSLGVAGIIVLNDKVGVVNGIIATIAGLGFVVAGVILRDGG